MLYIHEKMCLKGLFIFCLLWGFSSRLSLKPDCHKAKLWKCVLLMDSPRKMRAPKDKRCNRHGRQRPGYRKNTDTQRCTGKNRYKIEKPGKKVVRER